MSKSKDKRKSEVSDAVREIFTDTHGIIMNEITGYSVVQVIGTVYGLTVRSRNWGVDIAA